MKQFADIGKKWPLCPDCGKPVPPPQHWMLPVPTRCEPCDEEHTRQVEAANRAFL